MKTKLLAFVLLASASAANAAYISFSPASVSIPRGGLSPEITIRVSGDSTALPYYQRAVSIETRLTIPLAQLDFVEIVRSPGNSACVIMNGRLFVEFGTIDFTPLPIAVNSMCKFKLRARTAALPGSYAMTQGDFYSTDYSGNYLQNVISVQNAAVTITP
jgi:hypothetical protein